jgi:hypothetical protein
MMTMNNFEEWYKDTYPGVDPELDDMYSQLYTCYYTGYSRGAAAGERYLRRMVLDQGPRSPNLKTPSGETRPRTKDREAPT